MRTENDVVRVVSTVLKMATFAFLKIQEPLNQSIYVAKPPQASSFFLTLALLLKSIRAPSSDCTDIDSYCMK
jgi:hypothetical protein